MLEIKVPKVINRAPNQIHLMKGLLCSLNDQESPLKLSPIETYRSLNIPVSMPASVVTWPDGK